MMQVISIFLDQTTQEEIDILAYTVGKTLSIIEAQTHSESDGEKDAPLS